MNRDELIGSLKAFKRSAKMAPELARVAFGAVTRGFAPGDAPLPLLQPIAAPRRAYRPESSRVPVDIVSPAQGHYMTTFFDVDPVSPSGRYLVMTRVPFIWRIPYVGDPAQVVVVDLHEQTATPIHTTVGWGSQLGANVQWGADDETIYCNDVVDGRPTGLALDRKSGAKRVLEGPIYGLTPDRKTSFSGRLDYVNAGIPGYGVPDGLLHRPRQPVPENPADGIWKTDLDSGQSELFLSVKDIVAALPEQDHLKGGYYYVFNVKINPQGTRGFVVLFTRRIPGRAGWPPQLVTFDMSGGDLKLAMPDRLWRVGGHHPSWTPDGEHIVMNLRPRGKPMAFVRFRHDGEELEVLAPGHKGGGHPSLNPQMSHLLTDAYVSEGLADSTGSVPIRCIDLRSNLDEPLTSVFTAGLDGPRRIDPHPVWTAQGSRVVFNGVVDGRRQVMLADTSSLIAG